MGEDVAVEQSPKSKEAALAACVQQHSELQFQFHFLFTFFIAIANGQLTDIQTILMQLHLLLASKRAHFSLPSLDAAPSSTRLSGTATLHTG